MKLFNNLKIGTKMLTGFFMVAIIATIIGVMGIISLNTMDKKDTEMYLKMTVPMSNLYNMTEEFQKMRANVRDIILSSNAQEMLGIETKINENVVVYNKNSNEF